MYILIVPEGPRFDLRTSCNPSPAEMLTFRASPRLYIQSACAYIARPTRRTLDSALGFRSCAADMLDDVVRTISGRSKGGTLFAS